MTLNELFACPEYIAALEAVKKEYGLDRPIPMDAPLRGDLSVVLKGKNFPDQLGPVCTSLPSLDTP